MAKHFNELEIDRPDFLGGEKWTLRRLNHINVLLGRNGSGKSLLLRGLRDKHMETSHYVVPERTGEISFEAGLMVDMLNASGRRNQSAGNFSSNYGQQVVTRIQTYYTKRGTKPRAEIRQDPEKLIESLGLILPDFLVSVKAESPFYSLKRVKDGSPVTSVSKLSSGESQLLSIGFDILTMVGVWELDSQSQGLLLIDEPDAHIHPDLQIKFAHFLVYIQEEFNVQVLVATHSTTLMAALGQFGGDNVSLFLIESGKSDLRGERFTKVTKTISAILGGHLIMGPLFSMPIMLVEGDDDYRVWLQVARSGIDICVLPCNGEEIRRYERLLERVFSSLSENPKIKGIALVDGDKPLPRRHPQSPQNFIPYMRLSCHETENLYMTDEVLSALGYETREDAYNKVRAEAAKFGAKNALLRGIGGMDIQTGDFKAIVDSVAEILEPKKVRWSVRLGEILGRGRPTGMLKDFLGDPLLNYIWPA
jgi:predicted ATPase